MHRIDTPTAQIDKFGLGKNGFTNGDPSTGRRATDLNSDMWDAVQEEICNAIEKSGLALNKDQHDQLYNAIVKIITSKIPDALIRSENLSDLLDTAIARKNLGLKSAAIKDVVTTMTDTTTGRVPVVGWMGLGGSAVNTEITNCGFLYSAAGAADNPDSAGYTQISIAPSVFYSTRLAIEYTSSAPTAYIRTINGDTKNSWVRLLTKNDIGTSSGNVMAVGAWGWGALAPNFPTDAVTSVYWGGSNTAYAPVKDRGFAYFNIGVSSTYRTRLAMDYSNQSNPRLFYQNIAGTTYSPWFELYHTGHKPTAADVGAQSDTRMGAEVEVGSASFTTSGNGRYARAPAGHTLTGLVDYNHLKTWLEDIDAVLARPMQKQINGTWYTVSQL